MSTQDIVDKPAFNDSYTQVLLSWRLVLSWPASIYVLESRATIKPPYGYVLTGGEIVANEEKADVVRSIFEYYFAGASLGRNVDTFVVQIAIIRKPFCE